MLDEEKKEQKNMMLAMVLVIGVIYLFNHFMAKDNPQTRPTMPQVEQIVTAQVESVAPALPDIETKQETAVIPFENGFVAGDLSALDQTGIVIDNLKLTQYHETTELDSPVITLLDNTYTADLSWSGLGAFSAPVVRGDKLTPESPIVLTFSNENATLERTIRLDDKYLITYTDKITNKTNQPLSASVTGRISRDSKTVPTKTSTVHEGFLGLFDGKEKEERYASVKSDKPFVIENQGGWVGQTDKYWQTIFVPEQSQKSSMTFGEQGENYVSSFTTPISVGANETIDYTTRLFAGVKDLNLIESYQKQGIPRFDLSIDFGWYYFLTKPFLIFLGWLNALVGNMGVVILIFATLIRIALLPIATKSYESMAKMKKIQPKIKALQDRFKDNKQQLQIEMMNLYKRDKVNPASGCLPMLIQIPVFFALYKVLSVSILMRQAPFFGWITDLSQPDPSSVFTAFGYLPWPIPSFLNIGVWPLLMGLTMVVQQKLNPSTAVSKDQKMMMNLMPIIFTFMLGNFASGLVIYWTWSNILSIAQQKYIMKKVGV